MFSPKFTELFPAGDLPSNGDRSVRHDLLLWEVGAVTVQIGKEPSDVVKGMKQEVATKGGDYSELCILVTILGVYRFASYSDDGPLARL